MRTDSNYYKDIINKLERLNKREYALFAMLGIQAAALIIVSFITGFSLLEFLGNFSSAIRTVLFFILTVAGIASIIFLFILPLLKYFNLFRKTNYYDTAKKVGRSFPFIKDDLLNAMQLVSIDNTKNLYSANLIDAAFRNVYQKTQKIKFESIVDFKKARELFLYFSGVMVFCALLFLFVPGLQAASYRLVNFDVEFIPPPKFTFIITPGNHTITKGEDVSIFIRTEGLTPAEINIAVKHDEQTDFSRLSIKGFTQEGYVHELKSVRNSFSYYAEADNIQSEIYRIEVIDRPVIRILDVTINPPAYSGIAQTKQRDNGNITSLIGTNVGIELTSTKSLKDARLEFSDTTSILLSIDDKRAFGNFRVRKDDQYKILITDINGNNNHSPVTYSIKALFDAYPQIEMIEPNRNVSLTTENRLPLFLRISDDYGFTKLLLHYRLSASRYEPPHKDFSSVEIPITSEKIDQEINYVWNVSNLSLATEDVVTYYLEVFDNDIVSGPKSTKTGNFTIRIPSLDEILARADDTHNKAEQELKEVLKEAEDLKRDLERIDRELKQDRKDLSWQEKDRIEKALDRFEQIQSKVEEVSQELKEMQRELRENNLLSKETMEKYMELQKLMEQFTSEEMKKALEKMRKMLENLNRQQTQQAMEDLKIDEEQFRKSLERTLNLLKRIQIEQKIDELVKRTEDAANKQENLLDETKTSDPSDQNNNQQLSQKQDNITDDLKRLEEEMKELAEKMSELKDMPTEEMEKMLEELQQQQNQEMSQEASENLNKRMKQQAMQNQQQLTQNMRQMNKKMQDMQMMMMQMNQMQVFSDMMRILDNLINLSKQQEDLRKEAQQMNPGSPLSNDNAQKQHNLQQTLDNLVKQLADLSQKTFAISPEMGKALGNARNEMTKSLQALQNRNTGLAAMSQGEAMASLNEAATLMKGSMESMMQGEGQGGMMSLMQQLQRMSGQQMSLNNMTQMLQQMSQGQLSPQQQAEMQRLAQQQELIRKSLEELNKEARESGQSKALASNLDEMLREMREVVTDMQTQKLDDNLIQKQERILSKMLDAQRSIHERDFEKQRESFTGQQKVRESPAELNLSSEKGQNRIRDEFNKAVKEGYSRDYEELIRRYYEALQKAEIKN